MPIEPLTRLAFESGYLLVRSPEALAETYAPRYALTRPCYGLPRLDVSYASQPIHYRGLDRDAVEGYRDGDTLAELYLDDLERAGRSGAGFLFDPNDAAEALALLPDGGYELIWCRTAAGSDQPPVGSVRLGLEASYFVSDHFSPSCDCMLFPRWHGTDEEGTLFLPHFRELNRHGLFDAREAVQAFLDFYLSMDWTEVGDYYTVEVYSLPVPPRAR